MERMEGNDKLKRKVLHHLLITANKYFKLFNMTKSYAELKFSCYIERPDTILVVCDPMYVLHNYV